MNFVISFTALQTVFTVYILLPSILPYTNVKPHKALALIYVFIQEKSKPSLTSNLCLAIISF